MTSSVRWLVLCALIGAMASCSTESIVDVADPQATRGSTGQPEEEKCTEHAAFDFSDEPEVTEDTPDAAVARFRQEAQSYAAAKSQEVRQAGGDASQTQRHDAASGEARVRAFAQVEQVPNESGPRQQIFRGVGPDGETLGQLTVNSMPEIDGGWVVEFATWVIPDEVCEALDERPRAPGAN